MTWQNRIVGHDNVPPDQLLAHPDNWRVHPRYQQEALRGVINDIGYIKSVTVNKLTGRVVDGHLRVTLALRDGIPTIPVEYVELTEAEEAEALLTLDPIAALAGSDKDNLETLLAQVQTDDAAVMKLLEDTAADAGLDIHGEPKDAEPQIDRAAELLEKWQVKTGDLWQIGEHRLICGDCTDPEVVARVTGGERAELAPVDPPYNVGFEYDGETVDDEKTEEKYKEFTLAWFGLCQSVSDRQIVTPGCNNLARWLRWFDPFHWAPWTKSNSMTNGKVSRFWCWEPVLFFGKKWKRARPNDIFDYPIGMQKDVADHPCPKPLKMWNDLLEYYSEPKSVIFESFSGSGTTLVACQNLGRRGRAVEISPAYCAVTLERMSTAFPELEIKRL